MLFVAQASYPVEVLVTVSVLVVVIIVVACNVDVIVTRIVVEKLDVVETSGGTTVDVEETTVVDLTVTVDGGRVLVDVFAVRTTVILLRTST
jgi:hypothetical protein